MEIKRATYTEDQLIDLIVFDLGLDKNKINNAGIYSEGGGTFYLKWEEEV